MRERELLKDTIYVLVEEQVAMFLHTIDHSTCNRTLVTNYYRSSETISRYFHKVRGPFNITHQQILQSTAYYPYFKV